MTRQPIVIFRAMQGPAVSEDTIIRRFAFEGYGQRRARAWIREYAALDWISDNKDGTFDIHVPYRH